MSTINVNTINPTTGTTVTINGDLNVTGSINLLPYKVYTAWLSQTGTNNPQAEVLQNTLGATITWSRTSVGNYLATANSPVFTVSKTIVFTQVSGGGGASWPTLIITSRLSDTEVYLNTIRPDSQSTPIDQLPSLSPIEIRVYD